MILCPLENWVFLIIEGLICGKEQNPDAVNVPNADLIPGLPEDSVVEVPAKAGKTGLKPIKMKQLPEPILALLRTQASINKLLIEAYKE